MVAQECAQVVNAADHLGLAWAVAHRRRLWAKKRRVPMDEVDAQALFGLVKAARSFDPGRGVRFSTYATEVIDGYVKLLITRWKHSPQLPVGEEGETMEFAAKPEPDALMKMELLAAVRKALPARDALVVELRFGLGGGSALTLEEVSERLGLTRERVRQIAHHALARLRLSPALRRLAEGVARPVAGPASVKPARREGERTSRPPAPDRAGHGPAAGSTRGL